MLSSGIKCKKLHSVGLIQQRGLSGFWPRCAPPDIWPSHPLPSSLKRAKVSEPDLEVGESEQVGDALGPARSVDEGSTAAASLCQR